ncbi:MAG: Calx-beta domain-containing protein [Panacagrimonas sp.]
MKIHSALGSLLLTLPLAAGAQVQVSNSDASVTEGDTGTVYLEFNVQREMGGPLDSNLVIPYTVASSGGDPATAGSDYTAPPTEAVFRIPAGQTSGTLTVPVVGDLSAEADETLTVQLVTALAFATGASFPVAPPFAVGDEPFSVATADFVRYLVNCFDIGLYKMYLRNA